MFGARTAVAFDARKRMSSKGAHSPAIRYC